ncbi:MAG: helix-turn-helix transcriptional regulator [Chloroflexi bacterium]|nr:helix-turn-helix transcriptional regulator [Chloroflexota bacterium]
MVADQESGIRGERLRRARVATGLTVEEAAQAVGLSAEALAQSEQGLLALSLPHMELLSRLYGAPLSSLWSAESPVVGQPSLAAADYVAVRRKMIGVLLRQARLAHGKTLNGFAETLGGDAAELAAWEFGEADIPFHRLQALARLCGLAVSDLADPGLVTASEEKPSAAQVLAEMPEDVQEFISHPSHVLYIRVAMLLSQLPAGTLRQVGEGLLDITL